MSIKNCVEAYSEEMLNDCKNGKPCEYGICDECPNTLGDSRSDKDDEQK